MDHFVFAMFPAYETVITSQSILVVNWIASHEELTHRSLVISSRLLGAKPFLLYISDSVWLHASIYCVS